MTIAPFSSILGVWKSVINVKKNNRHLSFIHTAKSVKPVEKNSGTQRKPENLGNAGLKKTNNAN